MKQRLYWDLETQPLTLDALEKVMPTFEAPGNIKDPAKIALAIGEKKSDWIDKAALKAISGKIAQSRAAYCPFASKRRLGQRGRH